MQLVPQMLKIGLAMIISWLEQLKLIIMEILGFVQTLEILGLETHRLNIN